MTETFLTVNLNLFNSKQFLNNIIYLSLLILEKQKTLFLWEKLALECNKCSSPNAGDTVARHTHVKTTVVEIKGGKFQYSVIYVGAFFSKNHRKNLYHFKTIFCSDRRDTFCVAVACQQSSTALSYFLKRN